MIHQECQNHSNTAWVMWRTQGRVQEQLGLGRRTQGISGNRRPAVGNGGGVGRLRRHRREETHTHPGEGLFLSIPITN